MNERTFKIIPLDAKYWGIDFAINVNCGYSLEELKQILTNSNVNLNNYNMRIGYVRYIFRRVCEDYESNIYHMEGDYERVDKGGRGAIKCYIFEETPEASHKRWNDINNIIQKDWEEEKHKV